MVAPDQQGAVHTMVGMQNVDGTVWYWVDRSASQQAFDTAFESTDSAVSAPYDALIVAIACLTVAELPGFSQYAVVVS